MFYYEVAPNRIVRSGSDVLTYASATRLVPGTIVTIPVGTREMIGVIMRETGKPTFETKPVNAVVTDTPLPAPLLTTLEWIREYYAAPLASVLQTALPAGLLKNRRHKDDVTAVPTRFRTQKVLNADQTKAVSDLSSMTPGSAILHGITGSGKTLVYIELARRAVAEGRSVIVLVPEIALTSQVIDEFSHDFENVLTTHSRATEAQRHKTWVRALTATKPVVAIGPRSALFLPLRNIGLIIVDESHEPSYKQEQSPRYSALRVATILGNNHGARVVFGSATPLVADYYRALEAGRPIVRLPKRARGEAREPDVFRVDMTKRTSFKKHRFLSDELLTLLEATAPKTNQALIFHNRRGSASTTLCENCGWIATDPVTAIPLTLHADAYELRSHVSDFTMRVPSHCPVCGHADIIHKGIGTKLIESELRRLFPNKAIIRFDGDNAGGDTLAEQYKAIYDGDYEIIIGTQVVAKGLDLPHLRSVGVIQADAGLSLPDYGARERTFDLLAQVMGRVGRTGHESSVVVQSYQPDHPAVRYGIAQDYAGFYDDEVAARRLSGFPPFSFILRLTCLYKTEAAAIRNARAVMADLRTHAPSGVQVLGPAPAFYEYQAGSFRWQLTVRARRRADLLLLISRVPQAHWQAELDPVGLT